MAGPIQLGDTLRLAELAWQLWEYGWAEENNAGVNYKAFGDDVQSLNRSLVRLQGTIERAQTSLIAFGAHNSAILVEDQRSFRDIVGDYNETLKQCFQLVDDNRRYARTTGPVLNIEWNISVMPQVEHLRSRIQMHNSRILHLLKPFEIDMINNFHGNLTRRMMSMHSDVQRIRRDIAALLSEEYPEVARAIEQREEKWLKSIDIPEDVQYRLESQFESRGLHQPQSLQDLTDCFLLQFGRSTTLLPFAQYGEKLYSETSQYLALLKCQFLMGKIKASDGIRKPSRISCWPGYVRALEEDLSQQCVRFEEELIPPEVSHVTDEELNLWPTVEKQFTAPSHSIGPPLEFMLEVALVPELETMAWRSIQLFRQKGSEVKFRIIEEWCYTTQTEAEGPHVVDLDTTTAVFIPIYADPVGEDGRQPPLEIVLEINHKSFRYVFPNLKKLLQFQWALTGFQAVDSYMQSSAGIVFVRPRKEEEPEEYVTLQLWVPGRKPGRSRLDKGADSRTLSTGSQQSVSSRFGHTDRAFSISSSHSGATTSSGSQSNPSLHETVGHHGTVRASPRKPLLVCFTRHPKSSQRSIIAIEIDGETKPNPERCRCLRDTLCPRTVVEQGRGSTSNLQARRLGHDARWNLFSFPYRAPVWGGLLRASVFFAAVEARLRFGGTPCSCVFETEVQVDECIRQGHPGLLGTVGHFYHRQMVMVQGNRDARPAITTLY